MSIKIKAHIFACKKCGCKDCELYLCRPSTCDKYNENATATCEKYDEYTKLYKEIVAEQSKLDCAYALKEFDDFLGDIIDCIPEWKDTINTQRPAWRSTFHDRLYKKIVEG